VAILALDLVLAGVNVVAEKDRLAGAFECRGILDGNRIGRWGCRRCRAWIGSCLGALHEEQSRQAQNRGPAPKEDELTHTR